MATCARHQARPVFDPTACHIAFRSGRMNGSVPQGMSHDGTAGKSCLLLSLMNPTKVRLQHAGLHSLLQHNEETSCNLTCFTRQKSKNTNSCGSFRRVCFLSGAENVFGHVCVYETKVSQVKCHRYRMSHVYNEHMLCVFSILVALWCETKTFFRQKVPVGQVSGRR